MSQICVLLLSDLCGDLTEVCCGSSWDVLLAKIGMCSGLMYGVLWNSMSCAMGSSEI